MRYRRQYSRLSPATQMIGLQLWLPLLFVIAFCLCYVNAFHQPTPKHVKVAVVGTGPSTAALAERLQDSSHGALTVSVASSAVEVRDDVRHGDLAAAFTPGVGGQPAHLMLASAAQFQLAEVTQQTFAPVAAAQGTTLAVDDLAPLPKHDSYGTAGFYITLVFTIAAYMVGMFVGMMGPALRHRVRLGLIVGSGFVFALLTDVLVGPVVGAVHGHFWSLLLLGWSCAVAVGLVVSGLAYFLGRFVTGAALLLFVFLNIPSSGGAYPAAFVPEPFRFLHPYVFGTGALDALRHIVYDAGPGLGQGALVIGCYAAAGVLLTALGRPWFFHRARRRVEWGAPVSMMLAAQGAAMAARAAEQAAEAPAADQAGSDGQAGSGTGGRTAAGAGDHAAPGAPGSVPAPARPGSSGRKAAGRENADLADNQFTDEEAEADAAAVSGASVPGA